MNGFLLLVPFFLIRFGLMARLDRASLARAAHFAPMRGGERAAGGLTCAAAGPEPEPGAERSEERRERGLLLYFLLVFVLSPLPCAAPR